MNVQPLRGETEYRLALHDLEILVDRDPLPDSKEGKELGVLSALVEVYERVHFSEGEVNVI